MERQEQFDFDRAEQLGLIEQAVLPGDKGVSGPSCKHVLRAIDSYGRGREAWPSVETLAINTGLSVRTVKRAIRALNDLSLLVIDRRGRLTLNHYRIVWNELALLVPRSATKPAERSATVSTRSATVALEPKENLKGNEKPPPRRAQEEVVKSFEDQAARSVVERALRLGVFAESPVVEAVGRTDAGHVAECLDFYESHPGKFGAGALVVRLRRCRAGLPADRGWPPAVEAPRPRWRDPALAAEMARAAKVRAERFGKVASARDV